MYCAYMRHGAYTERDAGSANCLSACVSSILEEVGHGDRRGCPHPHPHPHPHPRVGVGWRRHSSAHLATPTYLHVPGQGRRQQPYTPTYLPFHNTVTARTTVTRTDCYTTEVQTLVVHGYTTVVQTVVHKCTAHMCDTERTRERDWFR